MNKNLIHLLWVLACLPISLFLIILWVYIKRKWSYFSIKRMLQKISKNKDEEAKAEINEMIELVDEANKNLKLFDYE